MRRWRNCEVRQVHRQIPTERNVARRVIADVELIRRGGTADSGNIQEQRAAGLRVTSDVDWVVAVSHRQYSATDVEQAGAKGCSIAGDELSSLQMRTPGIGVRAVELLRS